MYGTMNLICTYYTECSSISDCIYLLTFGRSNHVCSQIALCAVSDSISTVTSAFFATISHCYVGTPPRSRKQDAHPPTYEQSYVQYVEVVKSLVKHNIVDSRLVY